MIRERAFYKTLLSLALPSALQSFLSLLTVVADNVMISRYDPQNMLAAVSQVNSITTFVIAMLTGVGAGGIVLISQYWGKKDIESIRPICGAVCTVNALLSICVAAVAFFFPRAVLALVLDKNDTVLTDIAVRYFRIVCLSYLPFALTVSLTAVLKGVEVVRMTLYAAILSLIVNITFNYALIFGHLGLPEMGVEGAALATVLARIAELCVVFIYALKRQTHLPLRSRDLMPAASWAFRDYARFGMPVALGDTQWALVNMFKAAIIGHLGAVMISSVNIADTMANLATMFSFALSDGATVVIGKSVGAGDLARTRRESSTIQILFAMIGFVMCGIVFLLRYPFIGLYGTTPEIGSLAAVLIGIAAVTLLGTTYHAACFKGINRGAGDAKFVVKVDMICGWFVVLPLTALCAFVFKTSMPVVYLATRIDQCFKWIIAMLRLRGSRWIHNVTRPSGENAQ